MEQHSKHSRSFNELPQNGINKGSQLGASLVEITLLITCLLAVTLGSVRALGNSTADSFVLAANGIESTPENSINSPENLTGGGSAATCNTGGVGGPTINNRPINGNPHIPRPDILGGGSVGTTCTTGGEGGSSN